MNKKLHVLAPISMVVSFVAMVWLNPSPWSNLHYIAEAAEMLCAGLILGRISKKDEELLALSLMLPAMANYVLEALLVPTTILLAIVYYVGLCIGLEVKAYEWRRNFAKICK